MEAVQAELELIKKAKAGKLVEVKEKQIPEKGPGLRAFHVFIDDEYFEVGVEEIGGAPAVSYVRPSMVSAASPPQPAPKSATEPETASSKAVEKAPTQTPAQDGTPLISDSTFPRLSTIEHAPAG